MNAKINYERMWMLAIFLCVCVFSFVMLLSDNYSQSYNIFRSHWASYLLIMFIYMLRVYELFGEHVPPRIELCICLLKWLACSHIKSEILKIAWSCHALVFDGRVTQWARPSADMVTYSKHRILIFRRLNLYHTKFNHQIKHRKHHRLFINRLLQKKM